ncbi:MAG: hypothetical protein IPN76_34090 [Saprospiraceae bacterium]|nr:hypothetical protein [Saprospiraceae bacterium]
MKRLAVPQIALTVLLFGCGRGASQTPSAGVVITTSHSFNRSLALERGPAVGEANQMVLPQSLPKSKL